MWIDVPGRLAEDAVAVAAYFFWLRPLPFPTRAQQLLFSINHFLLLPSILPWASEASFLFLLAFVYHITPTQTNLAATDPGP